MNSLRRPAITIERVLALDPHFTRTYSGVGELHAEEERRVAAWLRAKGLLLLASLEQPRTYLALNPGGTPRYSGSWPRWLVLS